MNNYKLDEVISSLDLESGLLQTSKNGLLLTNYEISILNKYNIDYTKTKSLKEIMYMIEQILNEDSSFEDLESISLSIAERDYYMNTNK